MTALTIQDVSRRSGLSEPTLRYYEKAGLIGPIQRDASSRHRRYREAEIETLRTHLKYLRAKAALWDARDYADAGAETDARLRVQAMSPQLEEMVLR